MLSDIFTLTLINLFSYDSSDGISNSLFVALFISTKLLSASLSLLLKLFANFHWYSKLKISSSIKFLYVKISKIFLI